MMIIDINSIIKDNVAPLYNLCNSAEVIAMIACEGNDARTRQLLDFNRRCEEIMNLNLIDITLKGTLKIDGQIHLIIEF